MTKRSLCDGEYKQANRRTKKRAGAYRSKAGRYGGTYAHSDIAFEFASWLSPEFKLYIIKDYQRLKQEEGERLAVDWEARRALAKTNYRIHTDAIKGESKKSLCIQL